MLNVPLHFILKILLIFSISFNINACHHNVYEDPNKIALSKNFKKKINYTKHFVITSYSKIEEYSIKRKQQPLFVYIEGDGRAWITKFRLSNNPTPLNPLTLKLATLDPNHNVLYIARPCQFTNLNLDQNCHSKYWSYARYSIEVIESINEVIDNFKLNMIKSHTINNHNNQITIHLIGYSGGATIAGLIASIRNDVKSIRTIAGNLDHDAVSDFHKTSKLVQSLNLVNFIHKIKYIPQIHYIGENDQIIPLNSIENFVNLVNANSINSNKYQDILVNKQFAGYKIVKSLDHYHGWENFWKNVVNELP